jgi:hypothetical protein
LARSRPNRRPNRSHPLQAVVKEGSGPRRLIIRLNIAQPRKGDPEQLKAALLAEEEEEEEEVAGQQRGDRGEGNSRGSTPPPAGAGAPAAVPPQRARATLQLEGLGPARSPADSPGQPGMTPKPKGGVKFAAGDDDEGFGWAAGVANQLAFRLPVLGPTQAW